MPFTQKFLTERKVAKITSPLLIAASENDTTVPVIMSKELASLNPRAEVFISKNGSHHDSEWVKDRVAEFLKYLDG
jgi:pimeloyl-ACP methyl ester carboxylesterase